MLLAAVFATQEAAAQKHRSAASKEETVVYSDTTSSVDTAAYGGEEAWPEDEEQAPGTYDLYDPTTPVEGVAGLLESLSTGVMVFTIVMAIVALLALGGIIVGVVMLIRYIVRSGDETNRYVSNAYGDGGAKPVRRRVFNLADVDVKMWSRGVHLTSVGVALLLVYMFASSWALFGVAGIITLCIGVGRMVIAATIGNDSGKDGSKTGE